MKIFNSLSRKIEDFIPLNPPNVTMYTCGPTVYDFAHIGNFRTYTTADILLRVLKFNNYSVKYIMNLTDVGHLTGDNLGDADTGEDRMEKSAANTGKSVWDIAKFYTEAFLNDYGRLNLEKPLTFAKATDNIKEQIELVRKLEEKGYTYKTSDGIYFDTSKFPEYGKISDLDKIQEGARVEINPEKKNPRDFALWKFSPKTDSIEAKRQMEWESPWGTGFPGWHLECSAMSMKYLGESFDIHTGGMDLKSTHHPNEIAQSEAATGKPFVKYWVHSAFMLIDGKRMSKSLKNNYKLQDLIDKGFNPLAIRYLYLQTHYRQEMNFTWEALNSAQNALNKIYETAAEFDEPKIGCAEIENDFLAAINDDLNMPKALSILWELLASDNPSSAKTESLYKMDRVLGFKIRETAESLKNVPSKIQELVKERETCRKEGNFQKADELRKQIEEQGYIVKDTEKGPKIIKEHI